MASESEKIFNRERYRNELAQAIYELMVKRGVTRSQLAERLGVTRARITHLLGGEMNLRADTLADILLALGRTPHLMMDDKFDEIHFPHDASETPTEAARLASVAAKQ